MSTFYMLVIYNHHHEREEIHSGIPAAIFDEVAKDCQPDDYMDGTLKAQNDDAAFGTLIRAATATNETMHFDTDAKPVLWGVLNSYTEYSVYAQDAEAIGELPQPTTPPSIQQEVYPDLEGDVLNFAH